MLEHSQVGIAIAAHNSSEHISTCLRDFEGYDFHVVLFDDGSTDGTTEAAMNIRPDITVIEGDGSAWWTGGTEVAMKECFRMGCSFVLLLNPDTRIGGEAVLALVNYAQRNPRTIAASLVVNNDDVDSVAWAGSRRFRIPYTPIYTAKYIAKRGTKVAALGDKPYRSDEAHGRGVLITRSVYDEIGPLDYLLFPQYGGDVDYSIRARNAGIAIDIVPEVKTRLVVENSGMASRTMPWSWGRVREVACALESRKTGEVRRVLWHLNRKHYPLYIAMPSFLFGLGLILFRRMAQQ